jgi:hypothetical protein
MYEKEFGIRDWELALKEQVSIDNDYSSIVKRPIPNSQLPIPLSQNATDLFSQLSVFIRNDISGIVCA